MARRKRHRGKKHRRPDAEEVLAERVEIRVEALFDLIHHVNPTGKEVSEQERARRYRQKTGLQSLLIRRFGDGHVVVKATDDDEVVSLLHCSGAKDACHAIVSELEAAARSWVRRQLDLEASPRAPITDEPWTERRGAAAGLGLDDDADAGADELLQLGHKALADYDYEAAERHLTGAFEKSGGRTDAALALLDLRVGVLGLDRQALEIEPRLPAEARTDPGARTFLALAAARTGEVERALDLVKGTDLARTAEVYAALTAQAIRGHDHQAAARYLQDVSRHDPTHPEILRLTEEIEELRYEAARPAEEALERRYRDEGCLAAEDEARELLAGSPRSDLARQILREVAAHRREAEISGYLEAAEKALETERFDDAARCFQAARDAGSDRPDLPALIDEARSSARQRQEQDQVDTVVAGFSAVDPRGALLGYLSLPERLRARVRERSEAPALVWLDRLEAPASGVKAQAAVTAVLALEQAIAELRRGEAQTALDVLGPHREVLRGVEEARACLEEAGSRVEAERRQRAREALAAAQDAWDESRAGRAKGLLDDIALDALDAGGRQRARQLLAGIEHAETVERLERELERHLAADDLLGALDRARQLADKAAEPEPWIDRCGQLRQAIQKAWRVEVVDETTPLSEVHDFWTSPYKDVPGFWLDDEGRQLVLANAWGSWLFLRLVDVESRMVLTRVSLRTPQPLVELTTSWDGDRLWMVGARAGALEMSLGDWTILGWYALDDLFPEDTILEAAMLPPGGAYLWQEVRIPRTTDWVHHVIDLKARRESRRLPVGWVPALPVAGPGEARVLANSPYLRTVPPDNGARLYTVRGALDDAELRVDRNALCVAVSPDGRGLILVLERDEDPSEDLDDEDLDGEWDAGLVLTHFEKSPAGVFETAASLEFPDAASERTQIIATSLAEGLSFMLMETHNSGRRLSALAVSKERIQSLYFAAVAPETTLIQDRQARHAVAVTIGESSPALIALNASDPEPADPSVALPRRGWRSPDHEPPFYCDRPAGAANAAALALVAALPGPRHELRRFVREFEEKHAGDADELMRLGLALGKISEHQDEGTRIIQKLAQDDPRHAGAALSMADLEAEDGLWDDVLRRLRGIDPAELGDGRECHYHHLLGLAWLHGGRPEKALTVFEKGKDYERGPCKLEPLIELTTPVSEVSEASGWNPDESLMRQFIGAIRTSDQALAAGEPSVVRGVLERPVVWREEELQSAARLVAAYLEMATATPSERFRKRHALAFYCYLRAGSYRKKEILLPGLSWDESRLARLESRARAWLDEEPGFSA